MTSRMDVVIVISLGVAKLLQLRIAAEKTRVVVAYQKCHFLTSSPGRRSLFVNGAPGGWGKEGNGPTRGVTGGIGG